MTTFLDTSEDFHPYECDGKGNCCHCDRRKTDTHDPAACALCQEGRGTCPCEGEESCVCQ